jgi:hypothetical protein
MLRRLFWLTALVAAVPRSVHRLPNELKFLRTKHKQQRMAKSNSKIVGEGCDRFLFYKHTLYATSGTGFQLSRLLIASFAAMMSGRVLVVQSDFFTFGCPKSTQDWAGR